MCLRDRPAPYEGERWGFDNGAFSAYLKGESFPERDFARRLDVAVKIGTPYLAVTPDIVSGGSRSLEFSLSWLDRLPSAWPWYLAVQDGMDPSEVEDALSEFSGVFLGGTTAFKRTAPIWARVAHQAGKPLHYGRASVPRKVDHALRVGADSFDTSFPLWTTARLEEFIQHIQHGSPQLSLLSEVCAGERSGSDAALAAYEQGPK